MQTLDLSRWTMLNGEIQRDFSSLLFIKHEIHFEFLYYSDSDLQALAEVYPGMWKKARDDIIKEIQLTHTT